MKNLLIGTLLLSLFVLDAPANTPQNRGLDIATEMDKRDSGFGDNQADLVMVLKNTHGDESSRSLRLQTLETQGDGDKSLTVFESPADVKGTAFLSYTHATDADDQWLYLPALKRVKRISSRNKSGPFMGSEFAYEDLTSQELDKYSYKYLRDEAVGDQDCFVIERYPAYEHSGYTRQVVWVDKKIYQPRKIEFYDRKDALLKTLNMSGYQPYAEKYWRASRMEMQNHQTGKSTVLQWNNYVFKSGLSERDFNVSSLKRAR